MNVCELCTENHRCAWQNHDETICRDAPAFPLTNYDLIISKTPEEMAQAIEEFSSEVVTCPKDKCHLEPMSPYDSLDRNECRKCWLSWIKSPVEEDT